MNDYYPYASKSKYKQALAAYNIAQEILEEAHKYFNSSHPFIQYMYRNHCNHPDGIISFTNKFNDIVAEDMLKHAKKSE